MKKPWFQISKEVEYSTNFKFFFENQIAVVKSGTRYKFHSRLDGTVFLKKICPFSNGDYQQADIIGICLDVHKEVLAGKHGKGKLVD